MYRTTTCRQFALQVGTHAPTQERCPFVAPNSTLRATASGWRGHPPHAPAPYLRADSRLLMTLQQLRIDTSLSRGLCTRARSRGKVGARPHMQCRPAAVQRHARPA